MSTRLQDGLFKSRVDIVNFSDYDQKNKAIIQQISSPGLYWGHFIESDHYHWTRFYYP